MREIRDLHFKKEILPLFDFVCNEFSRETLTRLLTDFPDTLEEVIQRQDILKSILSNDRLLAPFVYSRLEFNEVYKCMEEIRNRGLTHEGTSLVVHFLFSPTEKNKERGRLTHLLLFLHKVDQAYFSHLLSSAFPESFGEEIKIIQGVLRDLNTGKYYEIVRRRDLTVTQVVGITGRLGEMIREGRIDKFWKAFFLFEAWLSIARGIVKQGFRFPRFNRDRGLSVKGFFHPLLKEPVANDLEVTTPILLITGPNMSGKSTVFKAIGLCVVLAHLGLGVPATTCELPFFEVISIAINLNDDIHSGYSHFMTEIKHLKNVVQEAQGARKCFAIFDELFRGTNMEDALYLSEITIRGLTGFTDCCFFISTHLLPLKDTITTLPDKVAAHYIECLLEEGKPRFTYRLRSGWSDLRLGPILFDLEGLPELLKAPERS